eukprot:63614-Amphidinium_carterae.1
MDRKDVTAMTNSFMPMQVATLEAQRAMLADVRFNRLGVVAACELKTWSLLRGPTTSVRQTGVNSDLWVRKLSGPWKCSVTCVSFERSGPQRLRELLYLQLPKEGATQAGQRRPIALLPMHDLPTLG